MTHGSLFSGIGGFDLAAEWMGWENKFHCEFNPFCQKVLKYYWPNAQSYDDITKSTFTIWKGKIDILTGGFPCQPYSTAGKRLGKEDVRHLWPEMLRVIREVKPRYIVGENVRGLISWNGGLVFDEVQSDLEAEGYEVLPLLLPAAGVNAPHRRDRIWFVAKNTKCDGFIFGESNQEGTEIRKQRDIGSRGANGVHIQEGNATDSECLRLEHGKETGNISESQGKTRSKGSESSESFKTDGINENATDSNNKGMERLFSRSGKIEQSISKKTNSGNCIDGRIHDWYNFPTVSPICNGDDGLSDRLDSITFSKWRKESIKAGGNAVVPQVVYQIFKTIEQINK